jgi:uncharacterized protein (DUF362 family)
MTALVADARRDARVAVAGLPAACYEPVAIASAIRRAADDLGWADPGRGIFANVVPEGARVVVKPNFVLHRNEHPDGGILPLITHQALIHTVVGEVLKANPSQVTVGDAPVQSCDLDELLRLSELRDWATDLRQGDARFQGIRDYRRTICHIRDGVRFAQEDLRPAHDYVLYNLGTDSLLEPLTDANHSFRVTCYDPRLMARTHSPANHQYLVAREIVEADVVINLPKLKTHKKAGITNALKNLVGINGNKEFLPHHRVGSAPGGGDCYPVSDYVKGAWETIADWQNMTRSPGTARVLAAVNTQLERVMRLRGDRVGVEGSWSGNMTVPRMTLDLNRILLYGRADATLADHPQRRVLHVVDAVIAGQGDGPLAPLPLPLGVIMAGENAVALDWVAAHLLGYDASRIPLLTLAFEEYRWPIAAFDPQKIQILGDWKKIFGTDDLRAVAKCQDVDLPAGWQDARAMDHARIC